MTDFQQLYPIIFLLARFFHLKKKLKRPFDSVSSKIRPHIKNKNIWINPVVVAWFVRAFGVIQSSTNSGFETQRCRFSEIV